MSIADKVQKSKKRTEKAKKKNAKKKHLEEEFPEAGDVKGEMFDDDDEDMEEEESGLEFDKLYDKKNRQNDMEEEEDWEDEEEEENLDIEFEFYDPDKSQKRSIVALINGYMDGLSYKSSDLAEIIINQDILGTMIGVEDPEEFKKTGDRDVIAFSTLLNIDQYKGEKVIGEIIKYIMQKSETHNTAHETLYNLVDNQAAKIVLLLNERVVNLSPQLVPMLHDQVVKDLESIALNNFPEAPYFNFDYVLVLSRCFKDMKKPTGKKIKSGFVYEDYSFPKFEDFEFLKNSEISFTFPSRSTKNAAGLSTLNKEDNQAEYWQRMVYLMTKQKYLESVANLSSYLDPNA